MNTKKSAEVWKPIKDFEGLYWISNNQRVKNHQGRILKPYNLHGALRIDLRRDGQKYTYVLSTLTIAHFYNL